MVSPCTLLAPDHTGNRARHGALGALLLVGRQDCTELSRAELS
ncbi:BQ5605_C003g01852 [Microbotryum silenes-dioicae]|uniref:BQ5605_C003g01852 protein n=1 Tax=Microbotryum silenes-dioicae TaxID=796604 RepID=A0A2X0M496_9BASI|nr:BQ5605_C003g01852 [Microbotryum silenes-dioicae]